LWGFAFLRKTPNLNAKIQFSMLNEIHRIASLHIRLFIVPNQYLYALLCHVFNIKNLIDLRALHTIEKEVSV
jgi:hypothetical protein